MISFKLHFLRFLPPALSLELTDLYLKLFKPLKVNKKHFQELTREAKVVKLEPGEAYAVEEVTPADEQLSILLKGKYVLTHAFENVFRGVNSISGLAGYLHGLFCVIRATLGCSN